LERGPGISTRKQAATGTLMKKVRPTLHKGLEQRAGAMPQGKAVWGRGEG